MTAVAHTPLAVELAIIGGGPVGSALALALATRWPQAQALALIDQRPLGQRLESTRGLALNAASYQFLQTLGAWPESATPIVGVQVSQWKRKGKTHIRAADLRVPALGYVVSYADLLLKLRTALARCSVNLAQATNAGSAQPLIWQPGCTAHLPAPGAETNPSDTSLLVDCNGIPLVAHGVVRAEGAPPASQLETPMAFATSTRAVPLTPSEAALVMPVQAAQALQGWAFQQFSREGTLALLPRTGADYTAVFTAPGPFIDRLNGYSSGQLAQWLNERMGDTLGTLSIGGETQIHAVQSRIHARPASARIVAIGNAAQTLHPVAAQGLNLGLRDAVVLAQHILSAKNAPSASTPDWPTVFQQFNAARRRDRWLSQQITTWLPRIFCKAGWPVEQGANVALRLLDAVPALHRPLTRQLLWGRVT